MKKIGKIVLIAFVVLVVLGALSSACSGSGRSSSSQASSSTQSAETAHSVSSAAADAKASFVGTWDAVKLTLGDATYSEQELKNARSVGVDAYLTINEDGTAKLVLADQTLDLTWEAKDASSLVLLDDEKEVPLTLKAGKLYDSSETTVFARGESRSAASAPTTKDSEAAAGESASSGSDAEQSDAKSSESGEVNPELKEMLDSYEAFIDEYVEFMERYQESGDVTSMLGEYADFLQRYNDFASKIDAVDTENMSAADYNYYIEVTMRCAEKSAKVATSLL